MNDPHLLLDIISMHLFGHLPPLTLSEHKKAIEQQYEVVRLEELRRKTMDDTKIGTETRALQILAEYWRRKYEEENA